MVPGTPRCPWTTKIPGPVSSLLRPRPPSNQYRSAPDSHHLTRSTCCPPLLRLHSCTHVMRPGPKAARPREASELSLSDTSALCRTQTTRLSKNLRRFGPASEWSCTADCPAGIRVLCVSGPCVFTREATRMLWDAAGLPCNRTANVMRVPKGLRACSELCGVSVRLVGWGLETQNKVNK
ncbi:hypothetical protein CERSUDRAFT_115099 [Gelatoporia subvermispora B]|uniref:Uncharacterized protein n=1 Tax=Ceriporiopsis subvermispora (strain B) TaxID=914234 RepID=M2PLG6_CERS8|nr:hypothetical protein CERSUDRAFT_115099 [Gelatoporia subvermispora B]